MLGLVQDSLALAQVAAVDLPGDEQHGRRGEARLEQARHGVGRAWSGAGDDHAQFSGGARVAVSGMSGGLLVSYPDRRDGAAPRDGVVHRQVVHAHDAEDMADAELLKSGDDRLSSRHLQRTLLILPFTEKSDPPGTSKLGEFVVILQSELDRYLQCVVAAVVCDAEGLVDALDRQQVAEQRGHVDRTILDQPHGLTGKLKYPLPPGAARSR